MNLWLWKRLFPKPISQCFSDDVLFLGIGTILNSLVPEHPPQKVVFGSGFGYAAPPRISNSWRLYCVRGPRTTKALGLPPDLAVSDGAMLVRELVEPATKPEHIAFMPHHDTATSGDWKRVCESLSIHYLDPRQPVATTLEALRHSSLVITEAMHGAIVADTLRIPWIPVRTGRYILDFKWQDWAESLEIDHRFEWLPPVRKLGHKRWLSPGTMPLARQRLRWLIHRGRRRLSADAVFQRVYERLLAAFDDMAADAT